MNNSNSILLIDPEFDPATATSCNLLVKLGSDSFSYAIINKLSKKIIAVYDEQECEDVMLKLTERFKNDTYLTLPYQEVKIAIPTPNSIAVPNVFYDDYSLKSHAKLFPNLSDKLYTQLQPHFDFTSIFSVSKNLDSLLRQYLPTAKKLQENTGLITIAEQLKETSLLLDFSVGSFNAVFINNQQVVFQQCYEIEQIEEFNYYLLLIINQLEMDTKKTAVFLSGIVHESDEKHNCMLKYFNDVEFLNVDSDLDQQILEDIPLHYYSNLIALNQCVL